jgi:hypothetical protein
MKKRGRGSNRKSTPVPFFRSVEESRVVDAGGRIQFPKMSIGPYGFVTLAVDSEGNMCGLHSRS